MKTLSGVLTLLGAIAFYAMVSQLMTDTDAGTTASLITKAYFILGAGLWMLAVAVYPMFPDSRETIYETVIDMLPANTVYWSYKGYETSSIDSHGVITDVWHPWIGKTVTTYTYPDDEEV